MFVSNWKKIIFFSILSLVFASCMSDNQITPTGSMSLTSLDADTTSLHIGNNGKVTRTSLSDELSSFLDVSDYTVQILDEAEKVVDEYKRYESMPSTIELPEGSFILKAFKGSDKAASFENPYFEGRTSFVVRDQMNTSVGVTCTLANARVTIESTPDFDKIYSDYTVDFSTDYIEEEDYDGVFGTGKVIAPMKGTNGSDRFYVMALNNIGLCYWYHTAKFLDSKYIVSASANDFAEEGAEPTGRVNTLRMVASWNSSQYGAQTTTGNIIDMWGIIQEEVTNGWFVPSKSEWAAFGDSFDISSNYSSTFGLSNTCWTSSQSSIYTAYDVYFNLNGFIGKIQNTNVQVFSYVRLATTF